MNRLKIKITTKGVLGFWGFVEALIDLVNETFAFVVINVVIRTVTANLKVIASAYFADCLVGKPTFSLLYRLLGMSIVYV